MDNKLNSNELLQLIANHAGKPPVNGPAVSREALQNLGQDLGRSNNGPQR